MKRTSGNGKWWLLFVVVCGLALWYRLRGHGANDTPPPPPRPVADAKMSADAGIVAAVLDAAVVEPPEPVRPPIELYTSDLNIDALSPDGSRALLTEYGGFTPKSLRVVDIATGKVESEITFVGYGADEPDPAALVDEMIRARAMLRGFPFGAATSLATTADGTAGVYWSGDDLYPMHGDKTGTKLGIVAAYDPLILADGKTLLFRGYHGRVDDEGVYGLAWATLDSPAPHEIDGTLDYDGVEAATASGQVIRIVTRQAPAFTHCVVDVSLAKPFKVVRKRCLDDTKNLEIRLSPHAVWVAWQTQVTDDGPTRLRTMNLDTGEVGIDVSEPNAGDRGGDHTALARGTVVVTDTGRIVIENLDNDAREIDPVTKARTPVTLPHAGLHRCTARGDRELVCEDRGSVAVVTL